MRSTIAHKVTRNLPRAILLCVILLPWGIAGRGSATHVDAQGDAARIVSSVPNREHREGASLSDVALQTRLTVQAHRLAPDTHLHHVSAQALAQPTPVIAGLIGAPAQGYLDLQGRFHSALAPYSVRSHWYPGEVGDPTWYNDRFTAPGDQQRYIDVLVQPNNRKMDTAYLERSAWSFLSQLGAHPHIIGRVRVLGTWQPIIGLTNLYTDSPHAEVVFATTQYLWDMDLATSTWAWPHDIIELTGVASSFLLGQRST